MVTTDFRFVAGKRNTTAWHYHTPIILGTGKLIWEVDEKS